MKNRGSWFVARASWIAADPDRLVFLVLVAALAIAVAGGWLR